MIIYADYYNDMKTAAAHAREYIKEHKAIIDHSRMKPYPVIFLMNGDVLCYLSARQYERWCIGRTYMLDGELYHSGIKLSKEASDAHV